MGNRRRAAKRGEIWIGTSGWHYDHWRGTFYPPEVKPAAMFKFYAGWFRTVEINNSFYRLPTRDTFAEWRRQAPDGFLYAVKGSRFITHMKKLKDPAPHLELLFSRVDALGDKLGPILFQLPPFWELNLERFRAFLQALPPRRRFAFEFRHPSWFDPRVVDALRDQGASAFCAFQIAGRQSPVHVTADFAYVRLHGPTEAAYQGSYSDADLKEWAARAGDWSADGLDVYIYFDNDQAGYAAKDAARLASLVKPAKRGNASAITPRLVNI